MSRSVTVGQLAERIGAELAGDPDLPITGAAPLEVANRGEISFLAGRRYLPYLGTTRASAVIVTRNLRELDDVPSGTSLLWVEDAHLAMAEILAMLYPKAPAEAEVADTATLGPGVLLGSGVSVGPHSVIGARVRLAEGVRVGANCVIGDDCVVGAGSELRDQVSLYAATVVGAGCIIHSGVRIGVDGFGYAFDGREHRKIPQVGRCIIEDNVEIGANSCIDRGSLGETRIGSGTKIDNLVHIAHNVRIGRNCMIVAQVGIAGSTTIGDGVALGGQVGLIGHLSLGDGVRVAAQSGVSHDIPAGETWFGSPARQITQVMRAQAALLKLPELLRRVRRLERRLPVERFNRSAESSSS